MCGGVSSSDARQVANDLRRPPDFLLSQVRDSAIDATPNGRTGRVWCRNVTPRAVDHRPLYALRDAPKMSEASYRTLLERNRARYGLIPTRPHQRPKPSYRP